MGRPWLVRRAKSGLYVVAFRDEAGVHRSRPTGTRDRRLAERIRSGVEAELAGNGSGTPRGDAPSLLAAFLAHKALTKTPDTARSYATFLRPMVEAWRGTPVEAWHQGMAEAYMRGKRDGATWVGRTAAIWLSGCREWIRVAREKGWAVPDFVGTLRAWSHQRRLPRYLNRDQVIALLAAARGSELEPWVALCALAGMRKREALGARPGDVDVPNRTLTVRGTKGHADRAVYLTDRLADVLARTKPSGGYVCPRVKHTSLYRGLERLCDEAGVPRVTWHHLRHAHAMALLDAGASVSDVQSALGHASLATTGVYLRARAGVLKDAAGRAFD
jgi:integrase